MSRITDYILEPKVVYTEGGFLVRVKVIDDYKYKKYIVSENLHYKTVQGTSFTLTDASSTKQASITELKGNTTQEGTPTPSSPVEVKTVSGDNEVFIQNKNLLANDIWEVGTISGTTGQNNNANNRIRTIGYVRVKPNTTYTLFIDQDTTTTAFVFEYDKQYSNFSRIPSTWTTMPFTFTTKSTTEYIRVLFGTSTISTAEKVQLEQNNQASSYILHEETNYNVSFRGRNKCVTNYKEWEVGGYGLSGNREDVQSRARAKELIEVQPSTTYYINTFNDAYKIILRGYGKSKNFISSYGAINNGGTVTTGVTVYYISVTIYNPNNTASTEGQNIIDKIQSEEIKPFICLNSEEDKTYVANLGIELCKIGNYQDKLYYDSGKWYIEKQVGKVVLNGSESWTVANNGSTGTYRFYISKPSDMQGSSTNFLSNYFSNFTSSYTTTDNSMYVGGANYIISRVKVNNSYITTVSDFQTWLGNNNVTVYYVRATPTYTEITDTYLLEQLNGLLDIELYENLCYVDWVGIEKPTMSLLYSGTEDLGIKYIITEDGKKIRTDWRKLGRRKKWMMK